MPSDVRGTQFLSALTGYARRAFDKANANSNSTLTVAEAKSLPEDLRDNFEAFRERGPRNRAVSVARFLSSLGTYAASRLAAADRGEDGVIDAQDAARLPVDLQDNFANVQAGQRGPAAPPAKPLQTVAQRRAAIGNSQLPAGSAVGDLARAMDGQLVDNNIMSGVVGTVSGKLPAGSLTADAMTRWSKAMLKDALKVTEESTLAGPAKAESVSKADALERAARILAEGNAYTLSDENLNELLQGGEAGDPERQLGINDLVGALGAPLKCVVASGKTEDFDHEGQFQNVGLALFVNTVSGEFAGFYGREGRI